LFEKEKNTILALENISISFSRDYKKDGQEITESKEILSDISLRLNEGEIVALMGGNGSGKTTLFNIISGLIKADTGKIIFKGEDITRLPPYRRAKYGIGRLFQDNHIFPNITVFENLYISDHNTFGEFPFSSLLNKRKSNLAEEGRKKKAAAIITELFEGNDETLLNKKNKLAGELSYGEKRLLGLARIFMGEYDLVLLDEPSAGVNESLIKNIQDMVEKLTKKNVTIFFIEHEKQFIEEIADRIIYLKNGRISANEKLESGNNLTFTGKGQE